MRKPPRHVQEWAVGRLWFRSESEHVLGCVACENEFLQDPLLGGVQLEYRPGLVSFLSQLNRLTLRSYVPDLMV